MQEDHLSCRSKDIQWLRGSSVGTVGQMQFYWVVPVAWREFGKLWGLIWTFRQMGVWCWQLQEASAGNKRMRRLKGSRAAAFWISCSRGLVTHREETHNNPEMRRERTKTEKRKEVCWKGERERGNDIFMCFMVSCVSCDLYNMNYSGRLKNKVIMNSPLDLTVNLILTLNPTLSDNILIWVHEDV